MDQLQKLKKDVHEADALIKKLDETIATLRAQLRESRCTECLNLKKNNL
jgi:hypothetical protein